MEQLVVVGTHTFYQKVDHTFEVDMGFVEIDLAYSTDSKDKAESFAEGVHHCVEQMETG
jgi:hypothetical protein